MRGIWGIVALMLAIMGLACHGKPKRTMKQPDVQSWDLPPDEKQFRVPPVYPEEKLPDPTQKKDTQAPMGGMKGGGPGGGGAPGGGMGGGQR